MNHADRHNTEPFTKRRKAVVRWGRTVVVVLAAAALVSIALEFGFDPAPLPIPLLVGVQFAAVGVYLVFRLFEVYASGNRWTAVRSCTLDGVLLIGAAVFLVVEVESSSRPLLKISALYVATMQAVLLIRLAVAAVRLNLSLSQSKLHPTRVLALTFVSLIVLGGLALSLPKATRSELHDRTKVSIPRHILNCMFTATSATCVTGLVVYDTEKDFTRFGQAVILVLIQTGGLGIMIFGSILGLLAGRQLSLKQSLVLQDAITHQTLGQLRTMVVFILIFTFTAEAVGALMLYPMWTGIESPALRLFYSVFHSVSAFCNAGFSLQSDSLVSYRRAWPVYGCVLPLIILGGLGFPVLDDLWRGGTNRFRRVATRKRGVTLQGPRLLAHRFTLHTKLVLVTSAVLIVLPTISFYLFESFSAGSVSVASSSHGPDTMAGASAGGRFLDALFYSVTCRTAGFNTVAMGFHSMKPESHLLGVILMFIGGSPASTAGGVKTVALAVLLLGVWTTLRGRNNVESMGRTIPESVVRRSAVLVFVMFALVSLGTLALCFTEQATLREVLFEVVSACGTVGLSTGLTADLTTSGRVVIMVAMFAGRLGPLTLLVALAGRTRTARYEYPVEHVGIG